MYFIYPIYGHRHEIEFHGMRNDRHGKLMDEYGCYYCRGGDCGKVFSTKSSRNRYTFFPEKFKLLGSGYDLLTSLLILLIPRQA